mgnify:CR=1 FL=1
MLRVVLCNCSPEEASELAEGLVEQRHAACVNILPGIESHYQWEGEVCCDTEATLLIKTAEEQYPAMKAWLEEHHSYDVPEIVALEAVDVLESYLDWAEGQVGSRPSRESG